MSNLTVETIADIEARDLRVGDDLFGYGLVLSVVYVGGSVRVGYGETGATFWPDEIVTVRRVEPAPRDTEDGPWGE